MSTRNVPGNPGHWTPTKGFSAHRKAALLLLAVLVGLFAACQSPPTATEEFTPPYLQLRLCGGKAQLQWQGSSEWTAMEGGISIKDSAQIVADTEAGAEFCLGDGSTLELAPEAAMEVKNLRVFPRLQVTLQEGSLLFEAQKPSYEFVLPVCLVTLLSIPSRFRLEVSDEMTHLAVEEGAVTCELETETLTLLTCWEMYAVPGEEPEVSEYCDPRAMTTPSALTPSPSPTPLRVEPTETTMPTPSPSPSPTFTPTLTLTPTPIRRVVIVTRTPTPAPTLPTPTNTPAPSHPNPPQPPPPPPPPTTEPPPPPTTEPPPSPTTEPPPSPTNEPRPTPSPSPG